MSILDKAGGVILFACAIPLLLLEEARALASVMDDLAAAREGRAKAEGERDAARLAHSNLADAMHPTHLKIDQISNERDTWKRTADAAFDDAVAAKRAAVELQAEVDKARAERDAETLRASAYGLETFERDKRIRELEAQLSAEKSANSALFQSNASRKEEIDRLRRIVDGPPA